MTNVAHRLALPSAASDRAEHLQSLAQLLRLLRRGEATTRSDLVARSGLSRSVVTQRIGQLVELGLAEEAGLAASTGGRAAHRLGIRGEAGRLLAVHSGATGVTVAVTDLNGVVLRQADAAISVSSGPDVFLDEVGRLADGLLQDADDGPVLGIGIGLPGPIEFASGRPTLPPIMPGWDGYDVRALFTKRFGAPTWVDNDANVLALGELYAGLGQGLEDLVYVKIGTGIGAGLVSSGSIHRGAQGAAGDVGHVAVVDGSPVVCRCGNRGCLEALAGGAAITRDAVDAIGRHPAGELVAVLADTGRLTPSDVAAAAQRGDRLAMQLLSNSGKLVGEMLATLVSFFNPALVVLGGSVAETGGVFLTAVNQAVYRRSLPLATRDLRIEVSTLGRSGGVIGAAALVLEEIFVPERLADWIAHGLPNRRAGSEGR